MNIVRKSGTGEVIEKKSRFIAYVTNIKNEEEANQIIVEIKKKYWDARHNCYAYVCGEKNEIQKFSDDGEPSGTAGKPILDVIVNSEINNCLIVVTRYFGGTLLGTGGLIRAYQASSKAAIEDAIIAQVHSGYYAELNIDYGSIGKIQYMCASDDISIIETEYGSDVAMKMLIPEEKIIGFEKKIQEAFSGKNELVNMTKKMYYVYNDTTEMI